MASTNYSPLYIPGVEKNFMLEMAEYDPYYRRIFHIQTTSMRYLWRQGWTGYGLPQQRDPGNMVAQGNFAPNFSKAYLIRNYGLGDSFPIEDERDDLYGVIRRVIPQRMGFMAVAFRTLQETLFAGLLMNQGFTSGTSVAGSPDGLSLFNTAHPVSATNTGKTVSNRPSVDADFSVTSYQAAATNLRLQLRPDGVTYIHGMPKTAVFNPQLEYAVKQILRSPWYPNTADRNVNYNSDDRVEEVYWPYWTKSGATGTNNGWFILGKEHYLQIIYRQMFESFNDFDTNILAQIINCTIRLDFGWDDWRQSYASPGI